MSSLRHLCRCLRNGFWVMQASHGSPLSHHSLYSLQLALCGQVGGSYFFYCGRCVCSVRLLVGKCNRNLTDSTCISPLWIIAVRKIPLSVRTGCCRLASSYFSYGSLSRGKWHFLDVGSSIYTPVPSLLRHLPRRQKVPKRMRTRPGIRTPSPRTTTKCIFFC